MPKGDAFIEMEVMGAEELGRRFGNAREYMLGAINRALRRSGQVLAPAIKSETPVGATTKLKNSTTFQILGTAEDMRMEVRQSAFSRDGGFPYGVAVRTGTKPHFPPIDALVPWVIKKLHVAAGEARRVAFLVARKISKVGTKPNPYHIRAFEAEVGKIKRIMEEEVVKFAVQVSDIPTAKL